MAKPNSPKNQSKPEIPDVLTNDPKKVISAAVTDSLPARVDPTPADSGPANLESPAPGASNPSSNTPGKKDSAVNRNKKGSAASGKGSSLTLSQHKLDHLKAAVAAAGSVENLLSILQHVDEAGGRHEVAESVEAYRALKLALE
jgi:hypothetical protein